MMSPLAQARIASLTATMFALACGPTLADDFEQPRSVRAASEEYDSYYTGPQEAAPSDTTPVPAPAPEPKHFSAPEPQAGSADPYSSYQPATATSPSCGCEQPRAIEPSCTCQPSCACQPSCGCGDSSCCGCQEQACTLSSLLCGEDPWFTIGGWTQLGYHSEFTPLSRPGNQGLSFNDNPHQINLHQQWLYLERVADGSCGLDFGFRADFMYGADAQKTQAFGNPNAGTRNFGSFDASLDHGVYGWAIPQLYGEVAYGDWSVIAGHFFTVVGYEVVPAPGNFFYSHALTMFNSEPFTHTGVLAKYSGDDLTLYAGWTLGWDTGFDQANSGNTYIGGFSGDIVDGLTVTYISTIGNLGLRSSGGSGYTHSIVFDAQLSDQLNYVLQSDYVDYTDNSGAGLNDDQLGINQYLFYTLNDCTKLGARLEWWKSDGVSYYEMTYGVNYNVRDNLVLRPEIRHDWSPTSGAYADGADNETTFGVDCVWTY